MLSMGGNTRHQAAVAGVCWLAEMDFASGTVYATTAPLTLVTGGHTYTGLGLLAGVSDVSESADSAAEKLTLSLSIVNTSMIAAALGSVEDYRGRAVRLYLQLLDEAFQCDGAPRQRWGGVMDRVQITRRPADADNPGPATGSIELQCSRSGMARARNWGGLRLTHQQQQARFAGDTGLRYMRELIDKPTPWLSVAFQRQ